MPGRRPLIPPAPPTDYTSGSTGRPKGVVIPHRGMVRLVRRAETSAARRRRRLAASRPALLRRLDPGVLELLANGEPAGHPAAGSAHAEEDRAAWSRAGRRPAPPRPRPLRGMVDVALPRLALPRSEPTSSSTVRCLCWTTTSN